MATIPFIAAHLRELRPTLRQSVYNGRAHADSFARIRAFLTGMELQR